MTGCGGCCFEYKSTARRWNCFVSFFGCLSAVPIVYYSIEMRNVDVLDEIKEEIDYLRERDVKKYLFAILITLASFILILSCCGMMFKWMRNLGCTMLYGTVLLPIMAATLGVGIAAIYISYTASSAFEDTCQTLIE